MELFRGVKKQFRHLLIQEFRIKVYDYDLWQCTILCNVILIGEDRKWKHYLQLYFFSVISS